MKKIKGLLAEQSKNDFNKYKDFCGKYGKSPSQVSSLKAFAEWRGE